MTFIAISIIGGAFVIEHGITKAIDRLITAIERATAAAKGELCE